MSDQSRTDRLAMNSVERLFLDNGKHELEIPSRDYGRDGRLIFNVDGAAEGYSTSLQVKGTRTATTDTESNLGFLFRCDVKTLHFLRKCQSPAYFVIHNCDAGTTYAREVHEIVQHLDFGRRGWRSRSTVTVAFRGETLLTPERIKHIADEARAWAMERETTWNTVKYIEKELRRFATVKSTSRTSKGERFVWMALRGGFRSSSAADTMGVLLFTSNLMHGLSLCSLYRQRMEVAMRPHEHSETAFAVLDLTGLTVRLESVMERHRRRLVESGRLLQRTAPEPLENPDWVPPRREGLMGPKIERLGAEAAAVVLARYLSNIGLEVSRGAEDPLDLIVKCGRGVGLLSLALYRRRFTRAKVRAVRERLGRIGASAGAILIHLSQGERLGTNTWPKPPEPLVPTIPIGTSGPVLGDFLAALLRSALDAGEWPERSISGTRVDDAFASCMPGFASDPDSKNSRDHQQAIVRRHAREALQEIRGYGPITFGFHWGRKLVETHVITCVPELIVYALKGPRVFHDLGGAVSRAGPDVAPPRARAECPTCGANRKTGASTEDGSAAQV